MCGWAAVQPQVDELLARVVLLDAQRVDGRARQGLGHGNSTSALMSTTERAPLTGAPALSLRLAVVSLDSSTSV